MLKELLPELCHCSDKTEEDKGKKHERKRSKWQECIANRRKGKPFDSAAIRELAKEYREGKCPP
jgi:hypothetical protein